MQRSRLQSPHDSGTYGGGDSLFGRGSMMITEKYDTKEKSVKTWTDDCLGVELKEFIQLYYRRSKSIIRLN